MTRFLMIQKPRSNQKGKRTMPIFAIIVLVFMVAGCEGAGTKQIIGTGAGAAIGGYAGSLIGKDEGRLAATAGGALLGAWLGSEIGKSLDKADQLYQAQATRAALEQQIRPGHDMDESRFQPQRQRDPRQDRRSQRQGMPGVHPDRHD